MLYRQFTAATILLLISVGVFAEKKAPVVDASGYAAMENRLARLERVLRSQGLLDLLEQVENLQREVARLQGDIEVQNHTIEKLQKSQRDLYADVDKRVQRIEKSGQTGIVDNNNPPPLETISPTMENVPANAKQSESGLRLETSVANTEQQAPAPAPTSEAPQEAEASTELQTNEDISIQKTTPPATEASADPNQAQAAYQSAFRLLKEARYDQATTAFDKYLQDYPQSAYADNAQYWLAESHYVQRNYEEAISAYHKLLENYPDSRKVAHSLLKLGYSHQELGQYPEARQKLDEVKNRFPGTTAARLADERLRSIPAKESNS